MKQAFILPGWYQKPTDNWYPWLGKELTNRGYQVFLPDLPTMHTDRPDMKTQLQAINTLATIDKDTVVIGHSIGCLLGMRLAETHTFNKLFLVVGWDFNDLTTEHQLFWPCPINHAKIKKNVKHIYCLSSDNDPYFTAITVGKMASRLNAKFILIKNAGHFTTKYNCTQIPEILNSL